MFDPETLEIDGKLSINRSNDRSRVKKNFIPNLTINCPRKCLKLNHYDLFLKLKIKLCEERKKA